MKNAAAPQDIEVEINGNDVAGAKRAAHRNGDGIDERAVEQPAADAKGPVAGRHQQQDPPLAILRDHRAPRGAPVVSIGGKYGEMMEVLDGLQEKERLVVVGQNTLTDGVKIRVVE